MVLFRRKRHTHEKTKEIYNEQHRAYATSTKLYNRFLLAALTPGFFGINQDLLKGKTILDAGCGTTGYVTDAMIRFGCASVTHLDIGDSWIPDLKSNLRQHGVEGDFRFCSGSTTKLPFATGSFDFVMSNGVIMHLNSKREARKAIKELLRVTKPGGHLYIYVGINNAGIMDKYISPAFRKAYKEDKEFKIYIDSLNEEALQREIREIYSAFKSKDEYFNEQNIETLISLFDIDSITFFQNALQVPRQQGISLDLEFISKTLNKQGVDEFQRIKEIYWPRNDFRRFLTPLHLSRSSKLGRLLYGDGHVKIICKKPLDLHE